LEEIPAIGGLFFSSSFSGEYVSCKVVIEEDSKSIKVGLGQIVMKDSGSQMRRNKGMRSTDKL